MNINLKCGCCERIGRVDTDSCKGFTEDKKYIPGFSIDMTFGVELPCEFTITMEIKDGGEYICPDCFFKAAQRMIDGYKKDIPKWCAGVGYRDVTK